MSEKIPAWLLEEIRRARRGKERNKVEETSSLLAKLGLSTVCDSARCPNRRECFSHHTATFLILGEVCTRDCAFCAVKHGRPEGPADGKEPERLSDAVSQLGLSHVVITSVTRDDLPDGGAGHYAKVIQELCRRCPGVKVEVLVPDFLGSEDSLATVMEGGPDVLAHNVETVPRLYGEVRRGANYTRSLTLLQRAKSWVPRVIVKSGLMLGLGETAEEIEAVLKDLATAGCDMVTFGQYLSPSLAHFPVHRYITRYEFAYWRDVGIRMGLRSVASGPLVRSSYKASSFFKELA